MKRKIHWEIYYKGVLLEKKVCRDNSSDGNTYLTVFREIFDKYISVLNVDEFSVYLQNGLSIFFCTDNGPYEIYVDL